MVRSSSGQNEEGEEGHFSFSAGDQILDELCYSKFLMLTESQRLRVVYDFLLVSVNTIK